MSIALALFQRERGDFLLESVEGGETRGRYSLIGLDPDLVFRARADKAEINREWKTNREGFTPCEDNSLTALRRLVADCRIDTAQDLPPVVSCLVGYFGYETIGLVETLPRAPDNPLDLPDMLFVRPSLILVFDSLNDTLLCAAPLWPEQTGDNPARAIEHAGEQIDAALAQLSQPIPARQKAGADDRSADLAILSPNAPAPGSPPSTTTRPATPPNHSAPNHNIPDHSALALEPVTAAKDYRAKVMRAKDYILAGDIFQVVLAQRFTAPFPLPPMALYRALRRVNPSPFLYFLDLPGFAVVGSSPEILVRVRRGEVTIRPIAGTRPRGSNPTEDAANETSLLADEKERAEHLMLLDLGRNDVGRVAKPGTVAVTASFTVERYSHVMHIVSNVTGALDPKYDAVDALFAGFPAGTVSGAPKLRACEIIAELEDETRGAYAGGVGYFAPDGSVDSCIVLRTAVVKDGMMHVQAGAGIVADSDPAYEQAECEAKAGALIAAAKEALRMAEEPGFGQ